MRRYHNVQKSRTDGGHHHHKTQGDQQVEQIGDQRGHTVPQNSLIRSKGRMFTTIIFDKSTKRRYTPKVTRTLKLNLKNNVEKSGSHKNVNLFTEGITRRCPGKIENVGIQWINCSRISLIFFNQYPFRAHERTNCLK